MTGLDIRTYVINRYSIYFLESSSKYFAYSTLQPSNAFCRQKVLNNSVDFRRTKADVDAIDSVDACKNFQDLENRENFHQSVMSHPSQVQRWQLGNARTALIMNSSDTRNIFQQLIIMMRRSLFLHGNKLIKLSTYIIFFIIKNRTEFTLFHLKLFIRIFQRYYKEFFYN